LLPGEKHSAANGFNTILEERKKKSHSNAGREIHGWKGKLKAKEENRKLATGKNTKESCGGGASLH